MIEKCRWISYESWGKRKILRGCFSQEEDNRSFVELINSLKFLDDIVGVKATYDMLKGKISTFVHENNEVKIISSVLLSFIESFCEL